MKSPLGSGSGWGSMVVCGTPGLSSAQCQELLRPTGWKEEAMATTGCKVMKAAAPGEGRGLRQLRPPGFPIAAGSRAQELPEVEELKCMCARSSSPGLHTRGIPGWQGPHAWEDTVLPAFSAPNPFWKSNRRRNPDRPVVPASSPPPPPRATAASKSTPSSAFTARDTSLA